MTTYFAGFFFGLSLIVAIGAQNAFVLRQGLLRQHVLAVCLFCALSDAILIAAGVAGAGSIALYAPWLVEAMRWGGAAFLFVYGARAFKQAWHGGEELRAGQPEGRSLGKTLLVIAALTWLNPHVYLDTVALMGAVSMGFDDKTAFAAGAVTGSFAFFFSLGYGARLLGPIFARPKAWQMLDICIGVIMWLIGLGLVMKG